MMGREPSTVVNLGSTRLRLGLRHFRKFHRRGWLALIRKMQAGSARYHSARSFDGHDRCCPLRKEMIRTRRTFN